MSVLPASWPSQLPSWYGHSTASFSALAAPVIPPLDPFDSPFPSPTHSHSEFSSALTAPSPPRRPTPHPRHQSPNPTPGPSALGGLSNVPPRNMRSLDRDALIQVLNFLSTLLPTRFPNGHQIRLVIHGGAVMLLNDELARLAAHTAVTDTRAKQRSATRDIDYIARSFSSEWAQRYGVPDANERLRQCTLETALQFGLGADWMNSDADVALPMATDPITGTTYDPIHAASLQSGDTLSVYTSPNGLLKLVSVTPFWAVALKMVRYNPADREDICILLRSGTLARQLHWTPARLELWLLGTCWAMNYAGYDPERIKEMRRRMVEVVEEVNRWDPHAVADDGRGGVVPLRQASWPLDYVQMQRLQQASPLYAFPGAMGGSSPLLSLGLSPETNSFPPPTDTSSTVPFILGPPTPASKTKKTKTKKSKSKTLAPAATWPNRWTHLPSSSSSSSQQQQQQQQQQWDPNEPEQWAEGIRQTAEKDGNTRLGKGNWFPWPWLRGTKSQPALRASAGLSGGRRWSAPQDSDFESDSAGSEDEEESDTDDEEWLQRQQLKWGRTGRDAHGHVQGGGVPVVPAGIQHSVADFMSNGMTPLAAPAVLATGPGPASEQQSHVLPGWNVPGAGMGVHSPVSWSRGGGSNAFFGFGPRLQSPPPPPPPWLSVYAGDPRQHQFSPPVHQGMHAQSPLYPYPYPYPYPQTAATPGPDTQHVAVGSMNALGLYAG